MRTEKEIRDELNGRRNAVQNLKFLYQRTNNQKFELQRYESQISIAVLEWVLEERELGTNITIVKTKDL